MTQQPPGPPYSPPPPGYGPPATPYRAGPPDHPQATTVLVLGIVGLVVCGLVAPFAWTMGRRVVREIDASNGAWGGRSNAQVGMVLGIVGTCLIAVSLVIGLGVVATVAIAALSSSG